MMKSFITTTHSFTVSLQTAPCCPTTSVIHTGCVSFQTSDQSEESDLP